MNDATANLVPLNPDRIVRAIFLRARVLTQLFQIIKWDPEELGSQSSAAVS
jgi:hypothetical protein